VADAGYSLKAHTTMAGEGNLEKLLQNMNPEMHDGIFVFCSIPEDEKIPAPLKQVHIFREREGTTLIVRREEAEAAGLPYQFASRMITLTVIPRLKR
jgi:hypothetical protein